MTLLYLGFLLALFGLSLILITLSLRHLKKSAPAGEAYPTTARFFLVALRIAIGWHCFVEGLEKISSPTWSSEAYLRESVGPLSDVFRWVPGDRLLARVTLGPADSFPAELDRDWQRYFDAFAAHYDLTEEQRQRAKAILEERKASTLIYLQAKKETVTKIAPYPPDLKIDMTMKQRLEEHERLLDRVRRAEAAFPSADKDVHAEWKTAKADLAKWRTDLKKSIDAQTDKLKKIDAAVKDKLKKSINELTEKWKNAKGEKALAKAKQALDEETEKYWEPLSVVLTGVQQYEAGPMPEPRGVPLASWRLLEYSDFAVKWSLMLLGAFLLLGFLSRATSLATALLVLSFYAAMPPLPGWPESPRLEGHYLLINKTLIEVIALLALTFIPTGRWVGLDRLISNCCGGFPSPSVSAGSSRTNEPPQQGTIHVEVCVLNTLEVAQDRSRFAKPAHYLGVIDVVGMVGDQLGEQLKQKIEAALTQAGLLADVGWSAGKRAGQAVVILTIRVNNAVELVEKKVREALSGELSMGLQKEGIHAKVTID